jgi:hypothetical protein
MRSKLAKASRAGYQGARPNRHSGTSEAGIRIFSHTPWNCTMRIEHATVAEEKLAAP